MSITILSLFAVLMPSRILRNGFLPRSRMGGAAACRPRVAHECDSTAVGGGTRFVQQQAPVSILFLARTRDELVDARCSRFAASLWGCALHEHESAGHDLALDGTQWLVEHASAWINELRFTDRAPASSGSLPGFPSGSGG